MDSSLETYFVPVRNELTGELRTVEIACGHYRDAQVRALHRMFQVEGWRKATALQIAMDADVECA